MADTTVIARRDSIGEAIFELAFDREGFTASDAKDIQQLHNLDKSEIDLIKQVIEDDIFTIEEQARLETVMSVGDVFALSGLDGRRLAEARLNLILKDATSKIREGKFEVAEQKAFMKEAVRLGTLPKQLECYRQIVAMGNGFMALTFKEAYRSLIAKTDAPTRKEEKKQLVEMMKSADAGVRQDAVGLYMAFSVSKEDEDSIAEVAPMLRGLMKEKTEKTAFNAIYAYGKRAAFIKGAELQLGCEALRSLMKEADIRLVEMALWGYGQLINKIGSQEIEGEAGKALVGVLVREINDKGAQQRVDALLKWSFGVLAQKMVDEKKRQKLATELRNVIATGAQEAKRKATIIYRGKVIKTFKNRAILDDEIALLRKLMETEDKVVRHYALFLYSELVSKMSEEELLMACKVLRKILAGRGKHHEKTMATDVYRTIILQLSGNSVWEEGKELASLIVINKYKEAPPEDVPPVFLWAIKNLLEKNEGLRKRLSAELKVEIKKGRSPLTGYDAVFYLEEVLTLFNNVGLIEQEAKDLRELIKIGDEKTQQRAIRLYGDIASAVNPAEASEGAPLLRTKIRNGSQEIKSVAGQVYIQLIPRLFEENLLLECGALRDIILNSTDASETPVIKQAYYKIVERMSLGQLAEERAELLYIKDKGSKQARLFTKTALTKIERYIEKRKYES